MKTVLCYGDSLTWGYDPKTRARHGLADRWPSVLASALGEGVHVTADGLNGRTTAFDDHTGDCDRNGARTLPTALHAHAPLDLVIFMLGSNDMKPVIAGTAHAASKGIRRLLDLVRLHAWPVEQEAPQILVVSPPPLVQTADPDFAAMFEGGVAQSVMLASFYADLADDTGAGFFDAGSVARCSPIDGVHLDAENTRAIGRGLAPVTRLLLGH
ncbi:SGNH/GDSL hydrolase family protein [Hoeflea sp. YIM 152468]|uniref:SGNH/GDSL hydrolase family protein n=1 Tax=Hoeflea sp. YIM 152468 TaxID=3031759 RepID=UPI0023DC751C|nr:SGNH/GDSL hydrolase family protein [Hoeflea sp. YIM 152468]MDF1608925.1 SGNH/GDSL hydrolase family protein [Hoeflea sp. YIM 152468]